MHEYPMLSCDRRSDSKGVRAESGPIREGAISNHTRATRESLYAIRINDAVGIRLISGVPYNLRII